MMKKNFFENFLRILEVFSKIICHKALKNICSISGTEVLNVPSKITLEHWHLFTGPQTCSLDFVPAAGAVLQVASYCWLVDNFHLGPNGHKCRHLVHLGTNSETRPIRIGQLLTHTDRHYFDAIMIKIQNHPIQMNLLILSPSPTHTVSP